MKNIEIFLVWVDFRSEIECPLKGCRSDIYVKIKDNIYNLCAYDLTSLKQEFDREIEERGYYYPTSNIIFVPEVTRGHIINTITHLAEPETKNFFSNLKPIDPEEVKKLTFTKIN